MMRAVRRRLFRLKGRISGWGSRGVSATGCSGAADEFVPASRALGAGLVRLYVYWSQVQPDPDEWDWEVVDSFLAQLTGAEGVWVTVCSSSQWAGVSRATSCRRLPRRTTRPTTAS